jgi:hypothetical protein
MRFHLSAQSDCRGCQRDLSLDVMRGHRSLA